MMVQEIIRIRISLCRKFSGIVLRILAGSALALPVACSATMDGVAREEGTHGMLQYEQGLDRDFYDATIDGENF